MSFLRKLFGLGDRKPREPEPAPTQDYQGCVIAATPFENAGRWQLSGIITKEAGGETKTHRFIRADSFSSQEDAVEMTFFKGRQIIDQNGDRLWLS